MTSLTIIVVNNKKKMLQLSPTVWSKGDIKWNSNGSIVAYTTLLIILCPTQMMNWTREKSFKDDEELRVWATWPPAIVASPGGIPNYSTSGSWRKVWCDWSRSLHCRESCPSCRIRRPRQSNVLYLVNQSLRKQVAVEEWQKESQAFG
jgi:hypothetical protein